MIFIFYRSRSERIPYRPVMRVVRKIRSGPDQAYFLGNYRKRSGRDCKIFGQFVIGVSAFTAYDGSYDIIAYVHGRHGGGHGGIVYRISNVYLHIFVAGQKIGGSSGRILITAVIIKLQRTPVKSHRTRSDPAVTENILRARIACKNIVAVLRNVTIFDDRVFIIAYRRGFDISSVGIFGEIASASYHYRRSIGEFAAVIGAHRGKVRAVYHGSVDC